MSDGVALTEKQKRNKRKGCRDTLIELRLAHGCLASDQRLKKVLLDTLSELRRYHGSSPVSVAERPFLSFMYVYAVSGR
ncbi:MAG: hypothetical protein WA735_06225 [Candidatus Acidiferrales bacterium]